MQVRPKVASHQHATIKSPETSPETSPVVTAAISLDVIDISGSHEDENTFSLTHDGDIHKIRISGNGKRLGEYVTPKQQWGPFMMRRPQEVSKSTVAKLKPRTVSCSDKDVAYGYT